MLGRAHGLELMQPSHRFFCFSRSSGVLPHFGDIEVNTEFLHDRGFANGGSIRENFCARGATNMRFRGIRTLPT
eukprot:5451763-Karenia_brevis.AAC.1